MLNKLLTEVMLMYKQKLKMIFLLLTAVSVVLCSGCSNGKTYDAGKVLISEPVDIEDDAGNDPGNIFQDLPAGSENGHPIFQGLPGVSVSEFSVKSLKNDSTGLNLITDFDGDGIPNDFEVMTNPYVADYPKIVTRITTPVIMEIRKDLTSTSENHIETVEETDVKETISNSMEDRHYAQMNLKTTPYVTKESYEDSVSHSDTYGYENSDASSFNSSGTYSCNIPVIGCGGSASFQYGESSSKSRSENSSISDTISGSAMSEKTVFDDINYTDNLDRNGIEYTEEKVKSIIGNYRKSSAYKNVYEIGPNKGYVRASFYIRNTTLNMPVMVSNVKCTLTFKTPAGEYLPVQSFRLRNDDYSDFEQEIYGGTEFGPYTIEINNLNTCEIQKALANGYVPQIHIISYDMHRVDDSNYNPGVDNLKIVEETVKGRTAIISIFGKGLRDTHRVIAYDYDKATGEITPGLSLKKALFYIYRNRIGKQETWDNENLTVKDKDLKWKTGSSVPDEYLWQDDATGNSWDKFETYIKEYTDESGKIRKIETIERIESLENYNPFNKKYNPYYNTNEQLPEKEFMKMKYWVILHNGRYFSGDINDPIWAGERYEIICVDVRDFNRHRRNFYHTPLQSMEPVMLDTRWNRYTNRDEFARSVYLGKVVKSDVVHLEVDIDQSRTLFNLDDQKSLIDDQYDKIENPDDVSIKEWYSLGYTFDNNSSYGVPYEFTHQAYGGTNSIRLEIEQSKNAISYEISLKEKEDDEGGTLRTVLLTSAKLDDNRGIVFLNSHTPDSEGNRLGLIKGDTVYEIKVKAFGEVYKVDVDTESISNRTCARFAEVSEPDSDSIPQDFTYGAVGGKNSIKVSITESKDAEFYIITVTGPHNIEGGEIPVREIAAHAGSNFIKIENQQTDCSDTDDNAGLYDIRVRAVNRNCIKNKGFEYPDGVQSSSGKNFITVKYDPYALQKNIKPAPEQKLLEADAVDLEVNFNDGSGWYRLMLESNDRGDKKIDCRYHNHIEYNRQKLHIHFKPPAEINDTSFFNVFTGGSDEVDLYIRTVAENKYRDTFWPVNPNDDDRLFSIYTDFSVSDFKNFWISHDNTDASFLETVINDLSGLDSTGDFTGAYNFGMKTEEKAGFFFSPLVHRKFKLKASYEKELTESGIVELIPPVFSVRQINPALDNANGLRIEITDPNSADEFDVHSIPASLYTKGEPVGGSQWQRHDINNGNENSIFEIRNMVNERAYIVAVRGCNKWGKSDYSFSEPVVVESVQSSNSAPSFTLSVNPDSDSINVNNIYLDGNCRYRIFWKGESDTMSPGDDADSDVSGWHVIDKGSDDKYFYSPANFVIDKVSIRNIYYVKVCAVDPQNGTLTGKVSSSHSIEAGTGTDLKTVPVFYISNTRLSENRYGISVSDISVPGYARYRIFWETGANTECKGETPVSQLYPAEYIIPDVENCSKYTVWVCALSADGISEGVTSAKKDITTGFISDPKPEIFWKDPEKNHAAYGGDDLAIDAGISLKTDFPPGISSYEVTYTIYYRRALGDWSYVKGNFSSCFENCSKGSCNVSNNDITLMSKRRISRWDNLSGTSPKKVWYGTVGVYLTYKLRDDFEREFEYRTGMLKLDDLTPSFCK